MSWQTRGVCKPTFFLLFPADGKHMQELAFVLIKQDIIHYKQKHTKEAPDKQLHNHLAILWVFFPLNSFPAADTKHCITAASLQKEILVSSLMSSIIRPSSSLWSVNGVSPESYRIFPHKSQKKIIKLNLLK